MRVKCPVCKKQWDSALQVARHIFGTGDKAHRVWVNAHGLSYGDLLIQQAAEQGNRSYIALAEIIREAQDKV